MICTIHGFTAGVFTVSSNCCGTQIWPLLPLLDKHHQKSPLCHFEDFEEKGRYCNHGSKPAQYPGEQNKCGAHRLIAPKSGPRGFDPFPSWSFGGPMIRGFRLPAITSINPPTACKSRLIWAHSSCSWSFLFANSDLMAAGSLRFLGLRIWSGSKTSSIFRVLHKVTTNKQPTWKQHHELAPYKIIANKTEMATSWLKRTFHQI